MDIKYDHLIVEKGKNEKWIKNKYFSSHDEKKKPFSIILPPPNVTGKLHLGHAWDGFIQDTIIRYKKLQGYDVCFVPGMDHAGIATQAKVEQRLYEQGIKKHEIGREEFIKQTFKWKDEYANLIHQQWAKLGLALDYDSERFTLDKDSNDAVNKVFIEMYNRGLIYRGIRPINWDPKLKTAISNIEVISKPAKSKMYYVKYFFENENNYIIVATTRIETLFSDVAIAIGTNDTKNKNLIGKKIVNPITKKILPIIADENIDPNFGTGFMKVSAHATIDIEIIQKNNLEIIECIDQDGKMNKNAKMVEGLSIKEARSKVFEFLKENNFIEKVEEIENNLSYSERSNEIVEILVMPQWFVKMDSLSKAILDNLESKDKVKIYPNRFENILKIWMSDAHDWNISRQLWWGHRIPAWYKGDEIKVQVDSPGEGWKQDEDVLDTWFSSALCPFSFLGWPNDDKKLKRFFPNSLLVTGYDIIFFWVARMYFQSLEFMNNIPFKDLLIHGLIRDEQGRKMSKSLGNGIDPMDVIDQYGSDSLRWFLLTNSTPGQDINFSTKKIENAWMLINKIWNISRYIKQLENNDENEKSDADIWITNKLIKLKNEIENKMQQYEFTIIGKMIYEFIYNDFSSWYIEFTKLKPNKSTMLTILKNLLILLHPFLPFVSDHLFKEIFNEELLENKFELETIEHNDKNIEDIINAVALIREFRNIYNISNKDIVKYEIKNKIDQNIIPTINKLANSEWFENDGALFSKNNFFINVFLPLEIKNQEREKTLQAINKAKNEILRSENILNNKNFMERASKEKVDEEKAKYEKYKKQLEELTLKMEKL